MRRFNLTLQTIRRFFVLLSIIILCFAVGYHAGKSNLQVSFNKTGNLIRIDRSLPLDKENINFSMFWQVWDQLQASYLKKENLDPDKMINGAISGMVASLGDPYTVYLPPQDQKQAKEDLAGSFEGVGIQLGYKDSKMAVVAPLQGTPADKAGIKAGDLIVKIRDEAKKIDRETSEISLPEAVTIIRGPLGTEVALLINRDGVTDPFEVKLKRDTIIVKSVEVSFENNAAILKLSRFGERTNTEWEEAVSKIVEEKNKNKNFKGVILDLRNNPGGYLQGAIYIASEFLDNGVVVKQENAGSVGTETFSVNRKGRLTNFPLTVLINQGSASASEIVAGAIKEKNRGKLVGEKTFGKGTIQEAQDLSGGAGLHITIARWLLPSGASIDKEGIKPDFEIKMDDKDQTKDPQLEKAIELLN